MNGAHDLGGKHGFAKIDQSQTENFVAPWEEKVFGLTLACGMLGQWNLDQSRYARECCDPAEYLASSYYEHWLHGLELLLLEKGLVTEQELQSGQATDRSAGPGDLTAVNTERVDSILSTGAATQLPDASAAVFALHDKVVVINNNPASHTRVPGYVKGKIGEVISHHGSHIFADEHAASGDKVAEHLYGVRFTAEALWGVDAQQRSAVIVDLFEPYLISIDDYRTQLVSL